MKKEMLNCTWLADNWPKILYDQISPEERQWVREHLASCPSCQSTVGSFFPVELWEFETPLEPVSPGFTQRVLAGLEIHPMSVGPVVQNVHKKDSNRSLLPRFAFLRPIFADYIISAAVTILLVYSGYFNLLPKVGDGAVAIGAKVEYIVSQTQSWGREELRAIQTRIKQWMP